MKRILLAIILCGAARASADPAAYTWYDGNRPVTVYVDARRAARVDAQHHVTLVEVTDADARLFLANGAMPAALAESYSPVFTTTVNGGARLALPGNVIVYVDARVGDDAAARAWLASGGLTVVSTLDADKRAYVVAALPGFESLKLANHLRAQAGVRAAKPVVWREVSKR